MFFFHLPPVSIIFLCNREHSNFPHCIPRSHPKTLLKFTTMLDANASVDHKLTQAFPSSVSTQHVRESGLFGTGHIPVDISFVSSRVQQNCSPAHPGVPKSPWFPNERGLHRVGNSAPGRCTRSGSTHIWLHCTTSRCGSSSRHSRALCESQGLRGYLQRAGFNC